MERVEQSQRSLQTTGFKAVMLQHIFVYAIRHGALTWVRLEFSKPQALAGYFWV